MRRPKIFTSRQRAFLTIALLAFLLDPSRDDYITDMSSGAQAVPRPPLSWDRIAVPLYFLALAAAFGPGEERIARRYFRAITVATILLLILLGIPFDLIPKEILDPKDPFEAWQKLRSILRGTFLLMQLALLFLLFSKRKRNTGPGK